MNTIKIHHLTDIHIGKLHYHPNREVAVVPNVSNCYNLDRYEHWLDNLATKDLPDLLIISGDITSYALDEEIASARHKLVSIAKRLKIKHRDWNENGDVRILLVPGNHDLDWSKEHHAEKTKRFADMASSLYHDGIRSPCCSDARNTDWIDFGDQANLSVALLDSTVIGGTNDPHLQALYQNLKALNHNIQNLTNDLKVLEAEMRKDPGYIDEDALFRLSENATQVPNSRIKIAVMHHNLTSVDSEDIDKFDTIINSGKIKSSLILNNFDLVLHGHRHVFDYSEYRKMPTMFRKTLKLISGDSFGCREQAPFIELEIRNSSHVSALTTPFATLSIKNAHFSNGKFEFRESPIRSLSPHIESHVHKVMRAIVSEKEHEVATLESLDLIVPQFEDLRHKIRGWNHEQSDQWIRHFHNSLSRQTRIFATDIDERGSIDSPVFHRYLREQYSERLLRLRSQSEKKIAFSDAVFGAIQGADWQSEFWKDYKIVKDNKLAGEQLEIVRILVRPSSLTARQREMLERIDFEHRMVAIPLFVVTESDFINFSKLRNATDFAISYSGETITSCYEFNQETKSTAPPARNRWNNLSEGFNRLLKTHGVSTIQNFGFPRPIMIRHADELDEFARNYDSTRKPSSVFLELLEKITQPNLNKKALDVGCGTGNYTIPFIDKFEKVTGVDALEPMLTVAKGKDGSRKVEWLNKDVILHDFGENQFDSIWGISCLHYFTKNQQRTLLANCFRWLKPGGVIFFEIEFYEQNLSLWVCEYFPSLISRYKNRCLDKETYSNWLKDIGFVNIELQTLEFQNTDCDLSLRAGQRNPSLFLDPTFREGLPAFQTMSSVELQLGLDKLKADIGSGTIDEVIKSYNNKAILPGDFGLIVARKKVIGVSTR